MKMGASDMLLNLLVEKLSYLNRGLFVEGEMIPMPGEADGGPQVDWAVMLTGDEEYPLCVVSSEGVEVLCNSVDVAYVWARDHLIGAVDSAVWNLDNDTLLANGSLLGPDRPDLYAKYLRAAGYDDENVETLSGVVRLF